MSERERNGTLLLALTFLSQKKISVKQEVHFSKHVTEFIFNLTLYNMPLKLPPPV